MHKTSTFTVNTKIAIIIKVVISWEIVLYATLTPIAITIIIIKNNNYYW